MKKRGSKAEVTLPAAQPLALADLVEYANGSIVSRTLAEKETGTITAFAFDEGQSLSEHTTPYDAFVCVLDGRAELTIGGRKVEVQAGHMALMPAGVPHAVNAPGRFKMLLVMLR